MRKQQKMLGAIFFIVLGILSTLLHMAQLTTSTIFLYFAGTFGGFGGAYGILEFFFGQES